MFRFIHTLHPIGSQPVVHGHLPRGVQATPNIYLILM